VTVHVEWGVSDGSIGIVATTDPYRPNIIYTTLESQTPQ